MFRVSRRVQQFQAASSRRARRLRSTLVAGALLTQACGGGESGESTAAYPRACSDLYDGESLPQFELEFDAEQWQGLEQDCEARVQRYRPATLVYGKEQQAVSVRLKGNWSWRCEKKQFVISFNELDSKARFHGLRKLVLDAAWYDPTLLAERVGMHFAKANDVPSSCVNNARLVVNGEYYGVYSNVERLDKEYLQRHFSEADGNLYQGGDELKTNEETADVSRRDALFEARDSLDEIERLADLDEAVRVWAVLAMLPDVDSYWAGVEINYYLYDHPTRGFSWLPYDMDMTAPTGDFDARSSAVRLGIQSRYVEADPFRYENPDWLKEPLFLTVLADPHWCNVFLNDLRRALEIHAAEDWGALLDRWSAQIREAVEEDPHKPFSAQDHATAVGIMQSFLLQRRQFIETWLRTASCPARW